jgi:hypothetical protein
LLLCSRSKISFSPYMVGCGCRFLTGAISRLLLDVTDDFELAMGETSNTLVRGAF